MGCLVLEKGAMLKQEVNVVASSELAILLRPLQLAVIVCIESKNFLNHLFWLLVSGGFVWFK